MNENSEPSSDPTPPPSTPTPPPVNPGPPPVKQVAVPQPAIEEPEELGEIQGIFGWVKALLKKPDAVAGNLLDKTGPNGTGVFLGVLLLCHLIYGVILGLFSGDTQLYLVPVKFLGGTILGALICYPSLFIFACLSGADVTPGKVFSMLISGFAMCSLLLVGFLPVSFIFTFSVKTVAFMGVVHLGVWFISMCFACRFIRQGLLRGVPRANSFLYIWNVVLIVTLLQMSTTLRPMLGSMNEDTPTITTEKKFFLLHWAENLFDDVDGLD
ncbi:MAG: hypothetical protein HN675_08125 [Opitutae bacterium]|nr:hypothetical protein [Opitutae bacterium]